MRCTSRRHFWRVFWLNKGGSVSIFQKRHFFFYAVVIVALLWIFLLDGPSFLTVSKHQLRNRELAQKINRKAEENAHLSEENTQLQSDPETWEKEARKLGMQKHGEEIYRFKQDDES